MRRASSKGGMMRVERLLIALLVPAAMTAVGCHNNLFSGPDPSGCEQGRLAYNLPPAERLMEPGPGVGGPGPGVIPPIGGGMGMGVMGMGMGGMMADPAVMQAGFRWRRLRAGLRLAAAAAMVRWRRHVANRLPGRRWNSSQLGRRWWRHVRLVDVGDAGSTRLHARCDLSACGSRTSPAAKRSSCSRRSKSRRSLRGPMPSSRMLRSQCNSRRKISIRSRAATSSRR